MLGGEGVGVFGGSIEEGDIVRSYEGGLGIGVGGVGRGDW